jgi:hypothetical protein
VTELVINSDNGSGKQLPQNTVHEPNGELYANHRTANTTGVLSPYHSKYNPIERCWAALENHWNGTLLSTIETVIEWAKTMTWKGSTPVVTLSEKVYKKGVSLSRKAIKSVSY